MRYKLKELGSVSTGNTPSKSNESFYNSDDIGFVKPDILSDSSITENINVAEYVSENARSKVRMVKDGAVFVTCIGSIGKIGIADREFAFNQQINAIQPNNKVISKYLAYCMLYNKKALQAIANAPVVPIINKSQFEEFEIEIEEDINEQIKIVEILDKVSRVLASRKAELEKLDDLIKARFVELFVGKNYPLVALEDLSLGKGEYGAQSASIEYDPSRPRYVRITDIQDDGTLNNDVVSSANLEDDEQYKLSYGDFMFARMGATVGKTYAYKSGNQIFAGYLIRYRLNLKKIIPRYLYAYTRLEEYKNWVLLNQSGAAQPGINAKKYGSLLIPVAPLEEQRAFEGFVQQVDKSKFVQDSFLKYIEMVYSILCIEDMEKGDWQ